MNRKLRLVGDLLILCLPLIDLATYIVCCYLPRQYYSKAIIEIKPDELGSQSGQANAEGASFSVTPFENLRHKIILYPVIDDLKLADKWGLSGNKEQAFFKLLKMMELRQIQNTNSLEIGVYSTEPKEAADIANTIAVVFQKKRRDDQSQIIRQRIQQRLEELRSEIARQRLSVQQASDEAGKIRERDGITDPNPSAVDSEIKPFSAGYRDAKNHYIQEKKILDASEERLRVETAPWHGSIRAVPWEQAEPALAPSRPDVRRNMLIASGVGFLFAIPGAVLILAGLFAKDHRAPA